MQTPRMAQPTATTFTKVFQINTRFSKLASLKLTQRTVEYTNGTMSYIRAESSKPRPTMINHEERSNHHIMSNVLCFLKSTGVIRWIGDESDEDIPFSK